VRNVITLVQQQSVLFNETIFRNIALGRRDHERVGMEEVEKACQFALLQETISDMPSGLNTLVGIGGNAMSGGQRQRIAIARARLRDTPVLVLDESTSALDQVTRSLVIAAIREWRRAKTTIVITHDVSQILENDFLYVMDNGRIVQEGYRKALVNDSDGLFCSFVKAGSHPSDFSQNHSRTDLSSPVTVQRSHSAALIDPHLRGPEISQDSLNIQVLESSRNTSSVFANLSVDLQAPRERLPPPPPPSIPPLGLPEGIESIELTGRTTTANRHHPKKFERGRPSNTMSNTYLTPGPPIDTTPPRAISWKERLEFTRIAPGKKRVVALKKVFATLWPALPWRGRLNLILGFLFALAHASATPIFGFCFANLLSTFYLQSTRRSQEAKKWSLAVLAIAITDAAASYFMHYLLEACGQSWVDSLRLKALTRILSQPRSWFDDPRNALSLLAESLDRNAEEMRNLVGRFAGFVFVAVTMVAIGITWSIAICWKLTAVGLAAVPLLYGITRGFEYTSGKWEGRTNDKAEIACAIFAETFENVRTVRALTLEGYFRGKYARATREAFRVGVRRAAYSGVIFGLTDSGIQFVTGEAPFPCYPLLLIFLTLTSTALIFYYGALLAASGQFHVSDILTAFSLLIFSMSNANGVITFSKLPPSYPRRSPPS
jgi:ATP-binding cassette, subfamily B (MDR/TAP), member 1